MSVIFPRWRLLCLDCEEKLWLSRDSGALILLNAPCLPKFPPIVLKRPSSLPYGRGKDTFKGLFLHSVCCQGRKMKTVVTVPESTLGD